MQLSSDTLLKVFSYYEETPEFRLETLLLVCRFWNLTALECKHIWSRFSIDIKNVSNAVFWRRQLPRRLKRSGPSSPIFFALHMDASRHCDRCLCRLTKRLSGKECEPVIESLEPILRAVLGSKGSLCARWREFDVRFTTTIPVYIPFLSHPTPQLTSLTLHQLNYCPNYGIPFLPSVPALRRLDVDRCGLLRLPDIRNVTELRFVDDYDCNAAFRTTNPRGLAHAEQAQSLELEIRGHPYMGYDFILPINLPSLERLHLAGNNIPVNMAHAQTPVLRELRVKFEEIGYNKAQYPLSIKNLVECGGLSFHQLDSLAIEFDRTARPIITDTEWDAYDRLLRICINVKKISGDEVSTVFVLRLLKDDCIGPGALADRPLIISNGEKVKEIRVGKDERLEDIKRFSEELGWPETEEDRRTFLRKVIHG